jgi:2-C-methyl-D-erythritol 2,4-cyclodiphosphate synthase
MPVGIGYDVHRFASGRRLVLCGVEFSSDRGLLGHSDADVATHAIMDALLGAACLGDIGQQFPPSDERFRDADSLALLGQVRHLLAERGWMAGNVDVTIVAEFPRIGPHVSSMRTLVGNAAGLDAGRVSVKATTNEGLGFLGRGEGIAAMAVAEIVPLSSAIDSSSSSHRADPHA